MFMHPDYKKMQALYLAYVYVQGQDLKDKTPEEVLDLYEDTVKRMKAHIAKTSKDCD